MKKFRSLGVLLSAVMLAACSEQPAEIAENTESTAMSATASAAATTTETTTEQSTTTTISEATTEEVTQATEEYVQASEGSEFINFEFIEDYQGTTDIGDLAVKAIAFMKKSKQYKRSADSVESFADEEFSEYISEGVIEPKLAAAYPNDYDGDGNSETFIIIKMPYSPPNLMEGIVTVRDFVIFADKDGNMEIVDETSNMYPAVLLNYGKFKHIAIGGGGMAGVEDHTALYGVKDGNAVQLYNMRGSFAKEDCFLSAFGWQGVGDFMYFDTSEQEYKVIVGVDVDFEDILAMDTTKVLTEDILDNYFFAGQLIGGKYYCFMAGIMDYGTIYTYDNGSFTLIKDSKVRRSDNLCELKEVVDIDIEQALANMKPVQK